MRHRRKYSESHGPVTMSFFKIVNEKKISVLASLFFPFLKSVQINFIFVDKYIIYIIVTCIVYVSKFKHLLKDPPTNTIVLSIIIYSSSIVNCPVICSNIPSTSFYGVHISQLIRYSRACDSSHVLP